MHNTNHLNTGLVLREGEPHFWRNIAYGLCIVLGAFGGGCILALIVYYTTRHHGEGERCADKLSALGATCNGTVLEDCNKNPDSFKLGGAQCNIFGSSIVFRSTVLWSLVDLTNAMTVVIDLYGSSVCLTNTTSTCGNSNCCQSLQLGHGIMCTTNPTFNCSGIDPSILPAVAWPKTLIVCVNSNIAIRESICDLTISSSTFTSDVLLGSCCPAASISVGDHILC